MDPELGGIAGSYARFEPMIFSVFCGVVLGAIYNVALMFERTIGEAGIPTVGEMEPR